tara:strand:- start:2599 stop:3147 length:549 start_codon:yes stop_codon:yes gene_type:complete
MIGNAIAGFTGTGVAASTSSYESIATATGTGASGTITFSSIPATYKHLQIRTNAGDGAGNLIYIRLNSDSGSNYAYHWIRGNGTAAAASGSATQTEMSFAGYALGVSSAMGVSITDIADYASTSKNKTIRTIFGYETNAAGQIYLSSGLWQSTSAITSISLIDNGAANFSTASTFALYGIKG